MSSIKRLSEVETVQSHACIQPMGSLAFTVLSIHATMLPKPAGQVLTVGAEKYLVFIWVPPALESVSRNRDSGKASLCLN